MRLEIVYAIYFTNPPVITVLSLITLLSAIYHDLFYLCSYISDRSTRMNTLRSTSSKVADLANKNTGYPVKSEFHANKFLAIIMFHVMFWDTLTLKILCIGHFVFDLATT
jgi:hypothetical protein